MTQRIPPFLFTLLFSTQMLNGCASTGATPADDTAPPQTMNTTTEKKKAATPAQEPECE